MSPQKCAVPDCGKPVGAPRSTLCRDHFAYTPRTLKDLMRDALELNHLDELGELTRRAIEALKKRQGTIAITRGGR